jgi:hypothetical protein
MWCDGTQLIQTSLLLSLTIYLRSFSILPSRLCPRLPGDLYISGSSTNTRYVFLFYRSRATRPDHLYLHDLLTRITSGEQYKSKSSWLCKAYSETSKNMWLKIRVSCGIFCLTTVYQNHAVNIIRNTWSFIFIYGFLLIFFVSRLFITNGSYLFVS